MLRSSTQLAHRYAEELDKKCYEIIEKYGLGDQKFTENEMFDPDTDPVGGCTSCECS
jgi:hypothetical protein